MFWAVVSYFITTLGTQLTDYLTSLDVTPLQGALISTGVGLGVVMIGVLIDHAQDAEPASAPAALRTAPGWAARPGAQPGAAGRTSGRTSLAGALVVILLLCGGGGLVVTYAAQWAAEKAVAAFEDVTGKSKTRPGRERLASPVSKTNGLLTITVNSVQVNDRATIIELTARNDGSEALTLPSGFCQLGVPDKHTLQPDPFHGSWGQGSVPSNGGALTGTIVFDGVLGAGTTKVNLAFTQIFGSGFDGPRDIAVDIPLT